MAPYCFDVRCVYVAKFLPEFLTLLALSLHVYAVEIWIAPFMPGNHQQHCHFEPVNMQMLGLRSRHSCV